MKTICIFFALCCIFVVKAQKEYLGEQLPKNPELGKCYVKQTIPDQFETKTFRIVEVPAHKKLEVVPAEYMTVKKEEVVRPASKEYKFIPAKFKTVVDTFWIENPVKEAIPIKPVFTDDFEEIEVKSKSATWEIERDPDCASSDPNDCKIFHYREVPAVVKSVPVKKLFTPSRVITKKVGGNYKLINRQVLVSPARTEEIFIPEVKEMVERRVLVKEKSVKEIEVPATYKTVVERVITKKGGVSWKEVPCASKSKNSLILPINFLFGSTKLTAKSKSVIDKHILSKLIEDQNMRILIESHTDSRGNAAFNQSLSERRSKSVVEYLSQKGIKTSRMIGVGYGESRLLNDCEDGVDCSESKHAKNRRTEFKFY